MNIRKISWTLVLYLALIEGISLMVLDYLMISPRLENELGVLFGFPIGFVPMFLVLALYKVTQNFLPVAFNDKKVLNLSLLFISFLNGVFLTFAFIIQDFIPYTNQLYNGIFVSLAYLVSGFIILAIYNRRNAKIRFSLNTKRYALSKISLTLVLYIALFELCILGFMYYFQNIHPFLNGLYSGALGGLIGWVLVSVIIRFNPLEISESL